MRQRFIIEMLSKEECTEILEIIAHNVHNQWMAGRLADGWKYGSERNDEKKEHPSLIPYEELSEDEKEYDRQTTRSVLKSLDEIGYKIVKKQ
ncbi:RyR domain-containing protein [Paludibacter sp.]|uniref:RyR domain-containing protein n=1 Tax=Paludibacter sp. TaxID=1898105 RepID=UPI00135417EE|nr:RyR domain-containing protein [Paludibacter sp.]MTK53107.1 Ryanodine receptor Ryr [Paludibacter sp.]